MRIDATIDQLRALLQLVEMNAGEDELGPAACGRGEEAVERGLPRPILERYQSLIGARRTPAVVAIERGTCTGCHMRLPTMLQQVARHALAVHTCPHCRRMLYSPELVRPQPRGEEKSRSRRAAAPARRS